MCTQLIRSQVEDQVRPDVLRKELNCQLREIDILHFVSFAGREHIEKDWLCLDHLQQFCSTAQALENYQEEIQALLWELRTSFLKRHRESFKFHD